MEDVRPEAREWELARAGDASARASLTALARDVALRQLAARRTPSSDVDDLAQETVRSFLSYLDGPGPAPREILGFLKWRALGVLSDHRRRNRARAMELHADSIVEPAVEAPGPIAAARAIEVRGALADCRARLTAEARDVLRWRYEGGLEAEEIAERLGVTRNAIHIRACRALAALRDCLERKGIDPEDAP